MHKFRVPNAIHMANEWVVQKLAHDFLLEDVWEYPIRFDESEGDSLYFFRKHAIQPMIKSLLISPSLSGKLFRLREIMGKLFNIDQGLNNSRGKPLVRPVRLEKL